MNARVADPASGTEDTGRSRVFVVAKAVAVLQHLNHRNGATVSALALATSLPRGTVFRLVETLVREQLLRKDSATGRYWLTQRVLSLSQGYIQEHWVTAVIPRLKELEARLRWPVNLSTPDGNWMEVRCATDADNRFVYRGVSAGYRFPMLINGVPNLLLAYRSASEQRCVLRGLHEEFCAEQPFEPWQAAMLERLKEMGATEWRASTTASTHSLSAAVFRNREPFALLTVWAYRRSTTLARLRDEALPKLLEAKRYVEALISADEPQALRQARSAGTALTSPHA